MDFNRNEDLNPNQAIKPSLDSRIQHEPDKDSKQIDFDLFLEQLEFQRLFRVHSSESRTSCQAITDVKESFVLFWSRDVC